MTESGPVFVDDGEQRLPAGTVVAGATVEGEMARGGMAIVYRARREDGTMAVLKVGTAEAATRLGTEQRYRNEERMGGRLHHPNIVRPIAVGCLGGPAGFEGRMFLLTQYVDAASLSYFMMHHAGGAPLDEVWSIGRQLSEALVAMHGVGIVHRDLKPDNVLVGDDGRVHVIDFGLAFSLGDVDGERRSEDLTLEGDAPGTPLYMSPQQAMHQPVSRSFDIYAMGVMLYEMCSGSAPHGHLPLREIAAARCDDKSKPLSLRIMAPQVPVSLVELIERCMAYEPEARPSAEALLAFFEAESPEERITAPELRVVNPPTEVPAEDDEPSDPTMIHRRPAVIAQGAREAGEETLVQLVRDAVDMPSVRRVRDELAKVDERIAVPKAQAHAAMGLDGEGAGAKARPGLESESAREGQGSRTALVVAAVLLLISVGAWFAFDSAEVEPGEPEDSETAPAALVESEALPEKQPESEAEAEPERIGETAGEVSSVLPETAVDPVPSETKPEIRPKTPRKKKGGHRKKARQLPVVEAEAPEDSAECKKARAAAEQAHERGSARVVLRATRSAKCWKSARENRRYLRTQAFLDVHDYDACVRAGRDAKDPETQAFVRICNAKLKDSP